MYKYIFSINTVVILIIFLPDTCKYNEVDKYVNKTLIIVVVGIRICRYRTKKEIMRE
jgi:hypothetical protein